MRVARALEPLLLVLAAACPLAAQNGSGSARVGGQPEVANVAFEGNEAFPDDSLALAIVNRQTECRSWVFQLLLLCPLGLDIADDRRYLYPRELPRDALRLELYYYARGFREAAVDTSLTGDPDDPSGTVSITFHIDEGRPVLVDSLAFVGLDGLPEAVRTDVLRRVPLREGDRLSAILLDASRDSLLVRLQNRGYAHADILRNLFIPSETPYEAEVEFDVDPGPLVRFGEIRIRWPENADPELTDEIVRRTLPFREGDVYGRDLLVQAQRNLFGLDIIRSASIQPDTVAPTDTIIPLTVRVAEADLHRVRTAAGWSSAECLSTEAQWTSRNFMGGARRLQVRGRLSNVLADGILNDSCSGDGDFAKLNWLVSTEIHQPWLFSARNSLTASVYGERQTLTDVFIRRAVGASLVLTRVLSERTPISLSYRPQLSTLEAAEVYFCLSFVVCDPEDVDVLQGANWLSPFGVTLTRSRTNDLLNPSSGYQAVLDVEYASAVTGSDFTYNRVILEGTYYEDLARRTVLAGRLRFGWIGNGEFAELGGGQGLEIVHPQKRFYAGGANSVRGFPQNRLGPRVLTVDVPDLLAYEPGGDPAEAPCTPGDVLDLSCDPDALPDGAFFPRPTGGTRLMEGSVEYRFAFGGQFQGVTFLDFGQVWAEAESPSLGDLEWSPGVGVRYFSPIGPIRIDVGYRFRGGRELQVVTSRIRPYEEGLDDPRDRICITGPPADPADPAEQCDSNEAPIPWVLRDDIAVLDRTALFGGSKDFWRRLQLHFSIGQAF